MSYSVGGNCDAKDAGRGKEQAKEEGKEDSKGLLISFAILCGLGYWKDVVFSENGPVSVYNLTKLEDGIVQGKTAAITLDYENNQILIRVTGAIPPNRVWVKVG